MDIFMWVECWSYDHVLQYCKLYQLEFIVCEIVKTVFFPPICGKIDIFLTHLSIEVAKNNFYVISWADVKAWSRTSKNLSFFITRCLCGHTPINYPVIKKFSPNSQSAYSRGNSFKSIIDWFF